MMGDERQGSVVDVGEWQGFERLREGDLEVGEGPSDVIEQELVCDYELGFVDSVEGHNVILVRC